MKDITKITRKFDQESFVFDPGSPWSEYGRAAAAAGFDVEFYETNWRTGAGGAKITVPVERAEDFAAFCRKCASEWHNPQTWREWACFIDYSLNPDEWVVVHPDNIPGGVRWNLPTDVISDNAIRREYIEKVRRKVRDALNKTRDFDALLECAKALKIEY